jgi:hypothetical protein
MQTQTQDCACTFDYYADADGPECVAVADWRAAVNNAGVDAPIKEVNDLVAHAPACLAAHGSPDDWGRYGLLALAARAGEPLTSLMDLVAA